MLWCCTTGQHDDHPQEGAVSDPEYSKMMQETKDFLEYGLRNKHGLTWLQVIKVLAMVLAHLLEMDYAEED